eukprot:2267173-Rhodomonas_salina.2
MIYIAYGPAKQRIPMAPLPSESILISKASAYSRDNIAIYMELPDGVYIPLKTEHNVIFACYSVWCYHTKDFDSDGWIAANEELERYSSEDEAEEYNEEIITISQ